MLKQGSGTHSVLRQRSAQLQKYKAVRLSHWSNSSWSEGVQWGWQTLRVDNWKLVNYTRIENAHKVHQKIFIFYYVAVICTITKGKEQIRAWVSRYDQCVWTTN